MDLCRTESCVRTKQRAALKQLCWDSFNLSVCQECILPISPGVQACFPAILILRFVISPHIQQASTRHLAHLSFQRPSGLTVTTAILKTRQDPDGLPGFFFHGSIGKCCHSDSRQSEAEFSHDLVISPPPPHELGKMPAWTVTTGLLLFMGKDSSVSFLCQAWFMMPAK